MSELRDRQRFLDAFRKVRAALEGRDLEAVETDMLAELGVALDDELIKRRRIQAVLREERSG